MQPDNKSLRNYYVFWVGQQISSFGSSLVSFIIIWWITITTKSPIYLALSSALSFGTMMSVQFFAGYLSDYFDRKSILGIVDLCQALATMVLVILFHLHLETIGVVLVVLAVRGVFDGLHSPAKRAIIPSMVPEEELQRINSLSSTARSVINLASPAVAALLLAWFSEKMWVLLSLDAITFLVALAPLLVISIPSVKREQSEDVETLKEKLTGGLTFLRSSSGLLPLLFIFASFNFFITPVSMLTPLIIYDAQGFDSNETMFALSIILSNLGFLLMSLVLTKYKLDIPSTHGIILGFTIAISGLLGVAYSIMVHEIILFLVSNFVIGLGFPVVNVFSSVIWQTHVPNELMGRVVSVRMIITMSSLPVVMILVGSIATVIHYSVLFFLAAAGFSMILLLVWIFTDFRQLDNIDLQHRDAKNLPVVAD